MSAQERLNKLENNYDTYKTFHLDISKKISLGNEENKSCRFCEKTEPEVTFENIAHAIPEFVNNHSLFSYYECDSCNSRFARTLETHMGAYMNPFHTLSQVRGKKNIPSYNKGGEKSRIDFKNNELKIQAHEGERESVKIDINNKTLTVEAIRATYIPIAVYKCLTKMALTLIDDEELIHFENAMEWINEDNHNNSRFSVENLKCIHSFTPGPLPHNFTTCILLRRKENHTNNVPYMMFLLAYGNYTFQIYIPMSKSDNGTIDYIAIPTPFDLEEELKKPKYKILDLSSKEKIRGEKVNIQMTFDKYEEIDPNNDDK